MQYEWKLFLKQAFTIFPSAFNQYLKPSLCPRAKGAGDVFPKLIYRRYNLQFTPIIKDRGVVVDVGCVIPVFKELMPLDDDGRYNQVLGESQANASAQLEGVSTL